MKKTSLIVKEKIVLLAALSLLVQSNFACESFAKSKGGGPWEEHIQAGRNALAAGDYGIAESQLNDAMKDTARFKDDDPRLGSTFYEMGQLNIRLQNYTLAKEYYERALQNQQKILGAESLEAANSLYGIALANQQLGDHLAAEIFLKRVDEIWRKKLGARDPKLISILPSMATYASMKNNLSEAEAYYKQLVAISESKGDQEELGTYLNLLAVTLGNEGKLSEAKDCAARAVDLLKKSSDSTIAIDSASDNLAILKSKTGEKYTPQEEKIAKASGPDDKQADLDAAKKLKEKELEVQEARRKLEEEKQKLALAKKQAEESRKQALAAKQREEEARLAAEKAKAEDELKLAEAKKKAAEELRLAELKARQAKEVEEERLAAQKLAEAKEAAALAAKKEAQEKEREKEKLEIASSTDRDKKGENTSKINDRSKPWHTDQVIKKPEQDKSSAWGKVRYLADGRLISAEEYKALLLANQAYDAMRQDKYRMAADTLAKALDMYPALPSAHTNLGLVLARLGKPEEAGEHLKLAISLDPSRSAPWVNLASTFQATGRLKDCVETYKEYLKRFPEDKLADKAKDLVKHLQEEVYEQDAIEKSIASSGQSNTTDYFPFTTASGTIKWTDSKLPVKVFVAAGTRVPGYRAEYDGILKDSFKTWSQASGEKISFNFVSKAEDADINCVWTDDYSQVSSPSEGGEAQVSWTSNGIERVKVVIITADPTPDSPLTQNQVQAVCLHEIGHSLGLIGHSPRPNDIMYCSMPAADTKIALSTRDISTIKHLYAPDVMIALNPRVKPAHDPTNKNSINNEGVELMSSHAYAKAIEKFEEALKLDPNYDTAKENLSRAYNNYALELSTAGNGDEAESLMQKAMKLQNTIRNAAVKLATFHNYAYVLRKLRRDSEADKLEAQAKLLDEKVKQNKKEAH